VIQSVCEAKSQIILITKSIFYYFELVSRLKVNFYKIEIGEIEIEPIIIETFFMILNYNITNISFTYLGYH